MQSPIRTISWPAERIRLLRPLRILLAVAATSAPGQFADAQGASAGLEPPVQTMLIKNALTAVNHGNLTGNYTVLRDLGSERFRQQNDAAKLATAFANQRAQHFDLSPILLLEPVISGRSVDEISGRVKLAGSFATVPHAVHFALIFQRTDRGWCIDEIAIGLQPPAPAGQAATPNSALSPAPQVTHLPLAERPVSQILGQPMVR
jgi:hypothetical protein